MAKSTNEKQLRCTMPKISSCNLLQDSMTIYQCFCRIISKFHIYFYPDGKFVRNEEVYMVPNTLIRFEYKKIGPGGMLEVLRLRHPMRFDLLRVNEIRQEISKLKRKYT
ncbi:hypothetical protein PHMEG_00013180 [Phytophthora megakarya]|uniref:Uncharacterized protein n=1 Tax=Phytophthora megakarya TaxID=4795 RepID=A0A225W7V9_9STRA|nr:hypothetical protein PHMEG_00013180 [Phytophthora megakarya]